MSVYKTRAFARFLKKNEITSAALITAARAVQAGHAHADLGGGVFKQRIPRNSGGKSGGFRTLIVFRSGGHVFFVFGFAKNERANINASELHALKRLAEELMRFSTEDIARATAAGELIEVSDDENA